MTKVEYHLSNAHKLSSYLTVNTFSIAKSNRLMRFTEIIAVCRVNHTEEKHTVKVQSGWMLKQLVHRITSKPKVSHSDGVPHLQRLPRSMSLSNLRSVSNTNTKRQNKHYKPAPDRFPEAAISFYSWLIICHCTRIIFISTCSLWQRHEYETWSRTFGKEHRLKVRTWQCLRNYNLADIHRRLGEIVFRVFEM